jgi:transposase
MMAQNDPGVVGIDVAKDKVDACIRAFKLRQTWPSTAQGQRKLIVILNTMIARRQRWDPSRYVLS